MNIKDESRREYHARINRVLEFLEQNYSQPLNLADIAEVAHFSPFHFHRIFTYILGESPVDYLQRIRLERAAMQLFDSCLPVSDIAFGCGFNSLSLFSRSFKAYYKVSPTVFRQRIKPAYHLDGRLYSKNGQLLSKNVKERPLREDDLCFRNQNLNTFIMEAKIEVVEMPAFEVVYCRHIGPFNQIGAAYGKLFQWAGPRGLIVPGVSKTMTITHDDPTVTEIEKIRQSACLVVDRPVKAEGEIGAMTVPGGTFAVGHFELGMEDFQRAWNSMCNWFIESGYQQGEGSPYELYHNDHTTHPEKKFIVDICIPVRKL